MADVEDQIAAQQEFIDNLMDMTRAGKHGVDAQIKLYLETTKTGKVLKETNSAVGKVTKGFVDSAKAMGSSTGSFEDLTGAVNLTIGAVSGLLSAIPVVGTALGKLGDATAEAASFAIGQVQKNYASFQELAKAGQIGADGVVGMANRMEEAGLPLATYTKLLSKNSEDLAYFSASALVGGKTFSQMISGMDEGSKTYMRNLGYSIEEIGESAIEYQALQRRRGYTGQMTQDQLTKGTENYISELDAVAKLTGMQVKDLKAQRDEVRADSRFRARLIKLRAEGNEKGAASLELFAGMLNKMNPEMRKGFTDITSGAINTEAALKLTRSGMLGTMKEVQAGLESGKIDKAQALNLIIGTSKKISESGGMIQGLAGVSEEAAAKFLDLAKTADIGNMTQKRMNELLGIQEQIKKKPDPTTNKLNTTMAGLEKTIATINKAFIATPLATDTINLFQKALSGSVNIIAEAFGESNVYGSRIGSTMAAQSSEVKNRDRKKTGSDLATAKTSLINMENAAEGTYTKASIEAKKKEIVSLEETYKALQSDKKYEDSIFKEGRAAKKAIFKAKKNLEKAKATNDTKKITDAELELATAKKENSDELERAQALMRLRKYRQDARDQKLGRGSRQNIGPTVEGLSANIETAMSAHADSAAESSVDAGGGMFSDSAEDTQAKFAKVKALQKQLATLQLNIKEDKAIVQSSQSNPLSSAGAGSISPSDKTISEATGQKIVKGLDQIAENTKKGANAGETSVKLAKR